MFEFGLFFRLHVGKDIFSAAEVLAADLKGETGLHAKQ